MTIDINFQTPDNVCQYMVDMIPKGCKTVFEPTPGLGNIVNALENKNIYNSFYKDRTKFEIITANDFFLFDKTQRFDCIVMNPPFSSKTAYLDNAPKDADIKGMKLGYYILTECMKMSDNVIALMPWLTISDSDVRMRFLKSFGIKSVTPLRRKTFNYARIQTVVIELQKGFQADTIFHTTQFKNEYNDQF